jgi:hypothetical protein
VTIQPIIGSCTCLQVSNTTSALHVSSLKAILIIPLLNQKKICLEHLAPLLDASVLNPGPDVVLIPYFLHSNREF